MQITFNTSLKLNNIRKPDIRNSYPNLSPLKHDTVTFGGNKIGVIKEMNETNYLEKQVIKIKSDLKETIEKNDASRIFEYFGIDVEADKSGLLTISEYRQPLSDITYSDVGIDENKLFEKIKTIQEDADFTNSQVIDLGKLESIGGDAYFSNSQVRNLGNLKSIGRDAYLDSSQIIDLGNLQSIGEDVFFHDSQVRNLGKLESIGGDAYFSNSQVRNLGNLKSIGRNVYFAYSQIIDLGNLKSIGGDAYFGASQIRNLGKLESIGGDADFVYSQITNLGNLKTVGGQVDYNTQAMEKLLEKRGLI